VSDALYDIHDDLFRRRVVDPLDIAGQRGDGFRIQSSAQLEIFDRVVVEPGGQSDFDRRDIAQPFLDLINGHWCFCLLCLDCIFTIA